MHSLYLATTFAGALVCFLASSLLFSRRKEGERSRIILAFIVLFSVGNYITRFIALCNGKEPEVVVSVPMILLGIFMIICYILYPIEAISPRWLNFKRLAKLYFPLVGLSGIYFLTIWLGVEYTTYKSLWEMLPFVSRFEVWFRLLLVLLVFAVVPFLLYFTDNQKYNNTNRDWTRKYVITLSVNIFAYILMLSFNNPIIHTLYYYVSVGCSLLIAYMELFVRQIGKSVLKTNETEEKDSGYVSGESILKTKNEMLIEYLDVYMRETRAWRDPELSLNALAAALCTNRTTLAQVIQENGYKNYTAYINSLRIKDFIELIESNQSANFQEAFSDAGFHSRATALRNFRQITGMIPSEYFQNKDEKAAQNK